MTATHHVFAIVIPPLLLAWSFCCSAVLGPMDPDPVSATITRFPEGKQAAFCFRFDDSMQSQVDHLMPLLRRYGFPVTFYINPGKQDYQPLKRDFEEIAIRAGNEIADHTMTHKGANDATAEYEMGEARITRIQ